MRFNLPPLVRRAVAVAPLLALLSLPPAPVHAEESDEPLYDEAQKWLKHPWLNVGLLLQVVGDYQDQRTAGGESGFSIGNARLSLGGKLDEGFSYFFQGNFSQNASLLDGFIGYRVNDAVKINAGLKKTPFSAEFLEGAAAIDFVNRSQVVSALAPNRQLGVEATGKTPRGAVGYTLGLFNGNRFGQGNVNDNDALLAAGRLFFQPQIGGEHDRVTFGLNVAHSDDSDATIGGLIDDFAGKRQLYGVDARLTIGRALLAIEAISAELEADAGGTAEPDGFHVTGGWMLDDKQQLLLRFDSFSPDGLAADSDLAILGYNLWPTRATGLQLNYIVPTDDSDFENHQLLVNLQVAL